MSLPNGFQVYVCFGKLLARTILGHDLEVTVSLKKGCMKVTVSLNKGMQVTVSLKKRYASNRVSEKHGMQQVTLYLTNLCK